MNQVSADTGVCGVSRVRLSVAFFAHDNVWDRGSGHYMERAALHALCTSLGTKSAVELGRDIEHMESTYQAKVLECCAAWCKEGRQVTHTLATWPAWMAHWEKRHQDMSNANNLWTRGLLQQRHIAPYMSEENKLIDWCMQQRVVLNVCMSLCAIGDCEPLPGGYAHTLEHMLLTDRGQHNLLNKHVLRTAPCLLTMVILLGLLRAITPNGLLVDAAQWNKLRTLYSQRGRHCPVLLLQRRWYEFRAMVHAHVGAGGAADGARRAHETNERLIIKTLLKRAHTHNALMAAFIHMFPFLLCCRATPSWRQMADNGLLYTDEQLNNMNFSDDDTNTGHTTTSAERMLFDIDPNDTIQATVILDDSDEEDDADDAELVIDDTLLCDEEEVGEQAVDAPVADKLSMVPVVVLERIDDGRHEAHWQDGGEHNTEENEQKHGDAAKGMVCRANPWCCLAHRDAYHASIRSALANRRGRKYAWPEHRHSSNAECRCCCIDMLVGYRRIVQLNKRPNAKHSKRHRAKRKPSTTCANAPMAAHADNADNTHNQLSQWIEERERASRLYGIRARAVNTVRYTDFVKNKTNPPIYINDTDDVYKPNIELDNARKRTRPPPCNPATRQTARKPTQATSVEHANASKYILLDGMRRPGSALRKIATITIVDEQSQCSSDSDVVVTYEDDDINKTQETHKQPSVLSKRHIPALYNTVDNVEHTPSMQLPIITYCVSLANNDTQASVRTTATDDEPQPQSSPSPKAVLRKYPPSSKKMATSSTHSDVAVASSPNVNPSSRTSDVMAVCHNDVSSTSCSPPPPAAATTSLTVSEYMHGRVCSNLTLVRKDLDVLPYYVTSGVFILTSEFREFSNAAYYSVDENVRAQLILFDESEPAIAHVGPSAYAKMAERPLVFARVLSACRTLSEICDTATRGCNETYLYDERNCRRYSVDVVRDEGEHVLSMRVADCDTYDCALSQLMDKINILSTLRKHNGTDHTKTILFTGTTIRRVSD